MPKNYSLNTLTDDILREVEEGQSMQKTAAELAPAYKSEIAQQVAKLAQELRTGATSGEVSYEDLMGFLGKHSRNYK